MATFTLYKKLSLGLLITSCFFPFTGLAQNLSSVSDLNNLLSVEINPHIPRANEKVSISIQSFRVDLNRADIAWFVNGDLVNSGTGLRSFSFTTGPRGTVSLIEIVMKPLGGIAFTKTLRIAPADVDIVWQTDAYVPPFYKGKTLYTYGTPITFVALPSFIQTDGSSLAASNLVYKWYTDTDTVFDTQSGYGKNTLSFDDASFLPRHVEVDVSSIDNTFKAHTAIDVSAESTQILLYQNNPLLGILFNTSAQNLSLVSNEITLTATPYFFNTSLRENPSMNYLWSINGSPIAEQDNNSSVTFRKEGNISGASNVGVTVKNILQGLQHSSGGAKINFGEASTPNLSF